MKLKEMYSNTKALFVASFTRYDVYMLLLIFFSCVLLELSFLYVLGRISLNGWIYLCIKTFFTWTLLCSLPLFFFGKFSRFLYATIIIISAILNFAILFAFQNYRFQLDGDIVGIILGSSPAEMKMFFQNYFGWFMVICILLFSFFAWIVIWCAIRLKKSRITKFRLSVGLLVLILFLFVHGHFMTSLFKESPKVVLDSIPIVHLFLDSIESFEEFSILSDVKKSPSLPDKVVNTFENENTLGVIVLGESATRNHLSIYGYERKTTPLIEARRDEMSVFEDLVAPSYSTAKCMPFIFTQLKIHESYKEAKCTISQILHYAGYYTALYSKQGRWGRYDSVESFVFSGCDNQIYMNEEKLNTPFYDDVLNEYIKCDSIKYNATKSVYFLHLSGSHSNPSTTYPHNGAPFEGYVYKPGEEVTQEKEFNHYDNSIWFTDKVLDETISICEATHRPSFVIYLSDHGETPSAKSWRQVDDNDLWEIPFFIWFSKEYRELHPEIVKRVEDATSLPLQSDELFWGFLEIAGIDCPEIRSDKNFLSKEFKPREKRIIGNRVYEKSKK